VSDIFDEVSADLRRDRATQSWERYGRYVIGAGVGIVLLVAAIIGYQSFTAAQEEAASERFDKLNEALSTLTVYDLRRVLNENFIAEEDDGYQALAMMQAGFDAAENGDTETALALFDKLTTRGDLPVSVRDFNRLQAAIVLLNTGASVEDIEARLGRLLVAGNNLRPAARETLALAHMQKDMLSEARRLLSEQLADPMVNNLSRERARIILSIVHAKLGPQAKENADAN